MSGSSSGLGEPRLGLGAHRRESVRVTEGREGGREGEGEGSGCRAAMLSHRLAMAEPRGLERNFSDRHFGGSNHNTAL